MANLIVWSGGQTGADQAAIMAAEDCGLFTGGWVPFGWKTDEGAAPWLASYGLIEVDSSDYRVRTEDNVLDTSATLWFGDSTSPGGKLTLRLAREHRKPFTEVFWRPGLPLQQRELDRVETWLRRGNFEILNCAGNRERISPGIWEAAFLFFSAVFKRLD